MIENNMLTKRERRELKNQEKEERKNKKLKQELRNRLILWAFVIIVIGLVVLAIVYSPKTSERGGLLNSAIMEKDQVAGNRDSKVVLIEYSDFQCPACKNYSGIVKNLIKEYNDKIALVYRHFPLKSIHKNAEKAAYAAEAAGKQNKFWEMHYKIFENQGFWENERNPVELFTSYARELNLNIEQFKNDIGSREIKEKVSEDYSSGLSSRVNSTPTFFLNGERLNNPRNYEEFKSIIDQSIRNSGE